MERVVRGVPLVSGSASGQTLVSDDPISFWGGVDPETGTIIDRRHDRCGESIIHRICFFPSEKGSSTASAVLLELARTGKAPGAIVTVEPPPVLMLGAIIAERLYGVAIPVLRIKREDFHRFESGQHVRISVDGEIRLQNAGETQRGLGASA